ncbi:uncharacterized protein LOC143850495 [Tasmannia lanceolata]|uniref:uncharacterized protein LOC143850495 n=1 Tax=Tasmannia lanceolata TaxID=3420 RepID=UPI0040643069
MNIILEIKCGNVEDSYRILPAFAVEIMGRNPGSYMRVFRHRNLRPRGDDKFALLFWTFSPCVHSFRTLRHIVLVDGAHLRGKYLGILLIVIGVDGYNGLYPLAFRVVETENEDSWEWFLKLLKRYVLPEQMNVFTICSDRQKGLLQAVPTIFSNCYHSYCMRHLTANFRSDFKDLLLERLFWRAARTLRESVFIETIEKIKAKNERAHKWISNIPKKNWANFYFKRDRYDVLTMNRSECFNTVLKDARKLLIASMVEHTRQHTTQFIQKRHKLCSSWHTKLTYYAEERMESSLRESCQYTSYRVRTSEFEVKSLETTDSVDLITRTCSCRAFQTYELPCGHAIAAINITEFNPYDYCDECFDAERYRDTYTEVVHATLDRTQWHESPELLMTILPPLTKRPLVRPCTRITDRKLKGGLHYKCTRCRQLGHNRRSCKEPPIVGPNLDESAIGPSAPILTRLGVPCQAPFFA